VQPENRRPFRRIGFDGEARLYSAELNSLFPADLNPCARIVATDGHRFLTSSWDSTAVDGNITDTTVPVPCAPQVPEPTTLLLLAAAVPVCGAARWMKKRKMA